MTVVDLAKAVRRLWWVLVATVVLGALTGAGLRLTATPAYQASTSAMVVAKPTGNADASSLVTYVQGMMSSLNVIVTTQAVLQPVAEKVGAGESWQTLKPAISTSVPVGSTILQITVTDADPQRAAQIANALPASLGRVLTTITGQGSAMTVTQVEKASPASAPIGSSPLAGATMGAVAGAAAGLFLISVIARFRTSSAGSRVRSTSGEPERSA